MMRTTRLLLVFIACLLAAVSMAASGDEPSPGASVPGQLDVPEMTAVALDARLPEGATPASVAWRIVEGEGGKLFSEDKEDAVFLAPKVEKGVKEFVVEVTVTYVDEPPSTRQLRIRVLSADATAEEERTEDGTPLWLIEHYERAAESKEQEKANAPAVPLGGTGGSSMSIGISGGSYGVRGGVGFRFSMSHPIEQPVDVPPPGQSAMPGEGAWEAARPVPYDSLNRALPADLSERYQLAEDPEPSDTRKDSGSPD
jgi:hypothetical protein